MGQQSKDKNYLELFILIQLALRVSPSSPENFIPGLGVIPLLALRELHLDRITNLPGQKKPAAPLGLPAQVHDQEYEGGMQSGPDSKSP
jgi:hypothetical protein